MKCPFCAKEIQQMAVVCKHCNRDLGAQPLDTYKRLQIAYSPAISVSVSPRNIAWIIVLGAIMAIVWLWLG